VSTGRIIGAFGDRPAAEVTTTEVSGFLRSRDREGLKPGNVNKHRQVLAAMFTYACRADTYALPVNPVAGTDKRREDPPAALDYYEVEEVEALARFCERDASVRTSPHATQPRSRHGVPRTAATRRRSGSCSRPACGARRGADAPLGGRRPPGPAAAVRRGLSAGQETLPKGRRHRLVPLPAPAARLADRDGFTGLDDYVLANRFGRRLDPSALRRRYKRGCQAAGLRPVRLHGLRYAAGSLIARTSDAVFVRDFLGHSKLATTEPLPQRKTSPGRTQATGRSVHPRDDQRPRTVVLRRPAGTRTRPLPVARTWVRVGIARVSPGRRNCHT
jgi:integrase